MDSVKSIVHSIVLATQHVRIALARHPTTTKDVRQVQQHTLVVLNLELQTIADASRAILEVSDNPCRRDMLDDRLRGWLCGSEPQTCLNALQEMRKLLNIDREVQPFSGFTSTGSGHQEDNINMAIGLFDTHRAYFHFLLTTDIWWVSSISMSSCLTAFHRNYEKAVLRQTMPSQTE